MSKDPVLKTCPKQLRHNPQRESRREIERNRERTSGKGRKRESLQPSSENDQAAASTSGRNGSHTHILTVQLCTQCGHWLNGKKRKQEPTAVAATTTTTTTADDVVDEEHTENRHNARPLFPHSHRAPPPTPNHSACHFIFHFTNTHTHAHTFVLCLVWFHKAFLFSTISHKISIRARLRLSCDNSYKIIYAFFYACSCRSSLLLLFLL